MTEYLVRFLNYLKENEAYNGRLITGGVQEHRMKILYPIHVTVFDSLQDNENKEAEIPGE